MPVLKEDKHSYSNNTKVYAKQGEKLKMIRDATPENEVVIVENVKTGVRFPCKKDELI